MTTAGNEFLGSFQVTPVAVLEETRKEQSLKRDEVTTLKTVWVPPVDTCMVMWRGFVGQ